MLSIFKRLLIGKTLKTEELHNEKFNVFWGLPILSSDTISSVAYAGEEILRVLIPIVGIAAYTNMFYVSLAIVILLFILVFSYRQTIENYPNGGGSYIVAKDNIGNIPGLVAGASLSIDYILTVAVSTSAGTAAITSAFPAFYDYRVEITLLLILLLTIGNLRGIKDSSKLFGIPTYLFIVSTLLMIFTGLFKYYVLKITPAPMMSIPQATGDIGLFIMLKAFSNGCTALTGVEAVSNGIPNFKNPAPKNAKKVLSIMAVLVLLIFGGTSFLATLYHAVPSTDKTVLSQIATQVFGNGFMFYVVQATTALILIMAANTAYADFPLLLSIISKDGYAPRQFSKRGDRLGFSNGIKLVSIASAILIVIFKSETHLLIPLYAIGVFVSFTLSQSGMFLKWFREKKKGWKHKATINGTGAVITFITVIIIGTEKFNEGAWIVIILIPIIIVAMLIVKSHYNFIADELSLSTKKFADVDESKEAENVIVLVDSLNQSAIKAINYGKKISNKVVAFHVSIDEDATEKLRNKWIDQELDIPLIIKASPYRDLYEPLKEFIDSEEHCSMPGDLISVIMPQFIVRNPWQNLLHNQTAYTLRSKLLKDRHIALTIVPYVIEHNKESKFLFL
jgi:amino acid transporter